ncbi:hypothetical protein HYV64_01700 [Candidatus Shapirobacteria bacterium]|nr:hypothetical protein [Candidatus Shapirobacteria bacterium]
MRIFVEGLWGLGKSTVCGFLLDKGYKFIIEPDHKASELLRRINLDDWYVNQFVEKVRSTTQEGDYVIERSLGSTLAYIETWSHSSGALQKYSDQIETYKTLAKNAFCIILCSDFDNYLAALGNQKDLRIVKFINENHQFIREYPSNLIGQCKYLFGADNVHIIKTLVDNKYINKKLLISKIDDIVSKYKA